MSSLNQPGGLTRMTSLRLDLPANVTVRPRKDGTFRVLFEVRRNRPDGWKPAIALPMDAARRKGNLNDKTEVALIILDATALNEELDLARNPPIDAGPPSGTLPAVSALWRASEWWAELKPRTQNFYTKSLWILEEWSLTRQHPRLETMDLPAIRRFLTVYKDRPAQQANLKRTLSALFSFAREEGIVKDHPFGAPARLRRTKKGRKTPVELWTYEIVETYGDEALRLGWAAGRRMLRLMWETSADASDVVTWRRDVNFRDGPIPAIVFERGKTGRRGVIPISARLAEDIRTCGQIYLVTNPAGRPYAADDVPDDNRRGRDFHRVRESVLANGGPRRVMDHLRHSAATDAIERGAELGAVTKLTLHANTKMLDQVYVQMTEAQALAVQRARGIVS